jgi:hypothetical protein
MSDWKYIRQNPGEALAQLHYFSVRKKSAAADVELHITVHEYAHAEIGNLLFFAQTDETMNRSTAPFRPSGWGSTLEGAVEECLRNIRRFEIGEAAPDSAADAAKTT